MMLYNRRSGASFEFDAKKARIRKLQIRVHAWATLLAEFIKLGSFRLVMLTLTYKRVGQWRPNHIRDFSLRLRRKAGAGLLAYAWVAELQERGAVHYHYLVLCKRGTNLPKPDTSGLWPHGSTRIETARTPYYICKYTGKEYQKSGRFPKGLRMFGVWASKHLDLDASKRFIYSTSALPVWLGEKIRSHYEQTSQPVKVKRMAGGGWEDSNGQRYYSPWGALSAELMEYDKKTWVEQAINRLLPIGVALRRRRAEMKAINAEWEARALRNWGSLADKSSVITGLGMVLG